MGNVPWNKAIQHISTNTNATWQGFFVLAGGLNTWKSCPRTWQYKKYATQRNNNIFVGWHSHPLCAHGSLPARSHCCRSTIVRPVMFGHPTMKAWYVTLNNILYLRCHVVHLILNFAVSIYATVVGDTRMATWSCLVCQLHWCWKFCSPETLKTRELTYPTLRKGKSSSKVPW